MALAKKGLLLFLQCAGQVGKLAGEVEGLRQDIALAGFEVEQCHEFEELMSALGTIFKV